MITFKKDSWHYKFNAWFEIKEGPWIDANDSKSICPYFWGTVWNLAWSVILLTLAWFVLTLIGLSVIEKLTEFTPSTDLIHLSWVWVVGVVSLAVGGGGVLLTAAVVVGVPVLIKDQVCNTFSGKEDNETKEPNVFVEWVKAKKAKICPMIEFKD